MHFLKLIFYIVRHIKSKRLSWVGNVERMLDEIAVKSIYKWKPTI